MNAFSPINKVVTTNMQITAHILPMVMQILVFEKAVDISNQISFVMTTRSCNCDLFVSINM